MSEINLKRFVDIDIKSNVSRAVSGTREVLTLFTAEGTAGTTKLISSLSEAEATYASSATTLAYLKMFFNNGGAKCYVIEGKAFSALTKADILALPNENILVAYAYANEDAEDAYTALKTLANALAADTSVYGINEKILLARLDDVDDDAVENFAVKYSTILGAEMTIAAYLTKINVYKQNTVFDYAFTKESITAENISDAEYEDITDANMNVAITLQNAVRNVGGNLKDGSELTNAYVKIMLCQTATSRLVNLLVQKLKNTSGIAQIYSVLAQELESYKSAGYLTTDKVWSNADLDIEYNGQTYTIVEQGASLTNGYLIKVLPVSALTQADKEAHKCPPVYLIIADQYGIRQITISGEVL